MPRPLGGDSRTSHQSAINQQPSQRISMPFAAARTVGSPPGASRYSPKVLKANIRSSLTVKYSAGEVPNSNATTRAIPVLGSFLHIPSSSGVPCPNTPSFALPIMSYLKNWSEDRRPCSICIALQALSLLDFIVAYIWQVDGNWVFSTQLPLSEPVLVCTTLDCQWRDQATNLVAANHPRQPKDACYYFVQNPPIT